MLVVEDDIFFMEVVIEKDLKNYPPMKDGLWDLPGFEEDRKRLLDNGYPCDWMEKVVDRKNEIGKKKADGFWWEIKKESGYAIFLKGGKHSYRSKCPHYEGFWLDGGIGSVQCSQVTYLLPGNHYYNTCEKNIEQCPFYLYKRREWNEQSGFGF